VARADLYALLHFGDNSVYERKSYDDYFEAFRVLLTEDGSPHCRQAGTFNMLLHDDMRATKAAKSIGFVMKQGCCPVGVEIDLPKGGAIKDSRRLQELEPNLMSYIAYNG
jgi:hypothetical protein